MPTSHRRPANTTEANTTVEDKTKNTETNQ